MTQHTDIKAARIAAEKAINTAPTQANFREHARTQALEVKLGELKRVVADIQAAGGLNDAAAAAALATLFSQL